MKLHPLWLCLALCSSGAWADQLFDAGVGEGALKTLQLTDVVTGNYVGITDLRFLPDGRMVFIEKTGTVYVRQVSGMVTTAYRFAVDSASEKGLLGLEVHPDFTSTRTLFFYYSNANSDGGTNDDRHRVVSIALKSDDTLDPTTEKVLVSGLRGPANHDGGGLAIGPDGKLYIGVGDTGCNCNCAPGQGTNTFATCLTNGNGKVLRINLDGSIPSDNPLVNETAVTRCGATCTSAVSAATTAPPRTDIWAWGFRNPWRLWFDPKNGNLWVGDVGEQTFEELNIVTKGRHYGWPYREGDQGQNATQCQTVTPQAQGNCVDPVYQCRHGSSAGGVDGQCTSINAGPILDHCSWPPAWRGQLIFSDNYNGNLFSLSLNTERNAPAGPGARARIGVISPNAAPTSMVLGPDGALYLSVIGFNGNTANGPSRIVRLAPLQPASCVTDDGGTPSTDGGGGGTDAATTPMDGGASVTPGTDAGETTPPDNFGCGCNSTSPVWLTLLSLALLGWGVGRRRW